MQYVGNYIGVRELIPQSILITHYKRGFCFRSLYLCGLSMQYSIVAQDRKKTACVWCHVSSERREQDVVVLVYAKLRTGECK